MSQIADGSLRTASDDSDAERETPVRGAEPRSPAQGALETGVGDSGEGEQYPDRPALHPGHAPEHASRPEGRTAVQHVLVRPEQLDVSQRRLRPLRERHERRLLSALRPHLHGDNLLHLAHGQTSWISNRIQKHIFTNFYTHISSLCLAFPFIYLRTFLHRTLYILHWPRLCFCYKNRVLT